MTIDNSKWDTVSFGDVARCLTVATKDPLSDGLNRYIGLEHIEPGNIHIKAWGEVAKGTTFTRVFRKGQVLFGKRRAYQKKAALAEFDGICSGDILVCEAIEGKLIPELLPFVVQGDRFFDFAIKTSAGSLSPRTKFKDLAKFSLKLPSKRDDQKRIADLLWGIDETIEKKFAVKARIEQLYVSCLKEIYSLSKDGKKQKVGALCRVNANTLSAKTEPSYRFKYLDISSILAPNRISDLKEYSFNEAPSRARRVVSKNSIVLSLVRPYFQSFVIFEDDPQDLIASTGTAVLDVVDGVDSRFLFHAFFTKEFLAYCEQRMNGSNYPAISPDDVKNFELIVPAPSEQRLLGERVSCIKAMESNLQSEIEDLIKIKQQIINKIFE